MTIEVDLPDGSVAEFPDGTPKEAIKSAIAKRFPPAQSAGPSGLDRFTSGLRHGTEVTGRALIEGATALPAMVGDAANALINLPIQGVNAMAGTQIPTLKPASQGIQDFISPLDKPANAGERILSAPIQMIGGVPAMARTAAATGAKVLAPLAENIPQQVYSALGGGLAQGTTGEVTDNQALQALATLGGGLAGGAAGASRMSRSAIPTKQQLKVDANAAYKAADDAGAIVRPDAIQRLASNVQGDLAEFGYLPANQPKVKAVLDEIDRIGQGNVTIKGIQQLRRVANAVRMSADPSEKKLGGMLVGKIDEMLGGLQPDDIVQGDAKTATEQLKRGTELWARYSKAAKVDEAAGRADLQAASTGSGGNVANTTRQAFKGILNNSKLRAGFTKDELAEMEAIVRGGPLTNALRLIGKLSPGGNGLMMALQGGGVAAGLTSGHPWTVAIPIAGMGAKALSDRATLRGVDQLSQLIRSGGVRQPAQFNQDTVALPTSLLRSLLSSEPSSPGQGGLLQLMAREGVAQPGEEDTRRQRRP